MGIGAGVSHHLVEGIAQAGRGTADFVTSEQRLERAVIQQLKHATLPVLDDIEVTWKFPEGLGLYSVCAFTLTICSILLI